MTRFEQEDGSIVELSCDGDHVRFVDGADSFRVPLEWMTLALIANARRPQLVIFEGEDRRVLMNRCIGCGALLVRPRAELGRLLHLDVVTLRDFARDLNAAMRRGRMN